MTRAIFGAISEPTKSAVEAEDRKKSARKISAGKETDPCYCGGIATEWKIGGEIYLQCDRCQMRTASHGDSPNGKDLLYHFWNNRPKIKG